MPKLEKLLRSIISRLGPKTERPVVNWDEENATFSIQVNARDQGRFIGKNGTAIWAIKSIFWYAGLAQIKRTVDINLREPEEGDRRATPFRPNPTWNKVALGEMIEEILSGCFNAVTSTWVIKDQGEASAVVVIQLEGYLQRPCSDPDLAEALRTLIFAAGMADGCSIKTEIVWK